MAKAAVNPEANPVENPAVENASPVDVVVTEEYVDYMIPPDPRKPIDEPEYVNRNGVDYLIKRGEMVHIPKGVMEILEESRKATMRLQAELEALVSKA